jgi:Lrp/AsnC family leucine-responsive transcriptional regulator
LVEFFNTSLHYWVYLRPPTYPQIIALINDLPEVLECHHVTENASFSIKAIASSISHLEALVEQLSRYGQTSTSIVLSSPVKKRVIRQQRHLP